MKFCAAAKGRSLFRLAAAALLVSLASAPQIATAEAAGYRETRDRLSGLADQVCDQVDGSLSRLSHLGYRDSYDENVVGSLLVPGRGATAREAMIAANRARTAELRARVGDLQAGWHRYQARPGNAGYSLSRWKQSNDILQRNRLQGRFGEVSTGPRGEVFGTPYGRRFVDVAPATEVKTGYATRTKFIRAQILKDVWLRRNVAGYTPLWEFQGTASEPLLQHLRTFGIPYRFR